MIRPPQRFGHANLICYALNTTEEVEYEEPKSYKEVVKSKEKVLWLEAMKEELYSLRKIRHGHWLKDLRTREL